MFRRLGPLALVVSLVAVQLAAQGLDTKASKDDWEEINFEYNSSVLVDGFPSLLRLAELLQKNADYKVRVEGHTDIIGSKSYNEKLGQARANTVRDFLVKYGARANQITTATRGFEAPRAPGSKSTYQKTDEARWMNRRVVLTVTDGQGKTVSDGSPGDAIRAIQPAAAVSQDCCNEILHRLDKLDTLERMLKDLADQNAGLRNELANLKKDQDALKAAQDALAAAQKGTETKVAELPKPPSTDEIAKAVNDDNQKRNPKFELLNLNAGPTSNGGVSFTGKGRYFSPFGDHYGFQSEGEYYYADRQREGQFDFGLVDRIGRFQAGLFSSFKHVNLPGMQTGGTIGQAALDLDYIFNWGRIGAYGTHAFLDDALINNVPVAVGGVPVSNLFNQTYLHVVNQYGVNFTAPLWSKNYVEGNFGYLKTMTFGDRFGGTVRLVFPVSKRIALTAEGGVDETLVSPVYTGRAVFGVQFGNFMKPKEFLEADHAVPMQIPRVRYEVLTRQVRVGNDAPVADAGPNQTLQGPVTVTLNGSGSYDPNGDPLTYQWVQETGPAVTLSAPTNAITTFPGVGGNVYGFKLTVKDPSGAQSSARVTITVTTVAPPIILSFAAVPSVIAPGQSSTLGWQVANADTITITALGNVAPTGSAPVSPATTTTYTITATKGSASATAQATVTVQAPLPKITSFTSTTLTFNNYQLICSAINSVKINLNGQDFPNYPTAIVTVHPTTTTTYTCIATGATGATDQQTLTITPDPNGGIDP